MQRVSSIGPLSVPHMTTKDVKLGKYTVPAGTSVFYNLAEISMDLQSFPEPTKFDPERHLDPETGAFVPNPRVQPFGIGKRRCLGETLAKAELYMFFTGIVGRFKLEPEFGKSREDLSLERASGLVCGPGQSFKVRFTPREYNPKDCGRCTYFYSQK